MSIDAQIASIEIFPPIGIARVGNSHEFYIGPEVPGRFDTPDAGTNHEGFKDKHHKVKRQAARFRVYAFDKSGNVLEELNSAGGYELSWTVEVMNKKPSWYTFMGRTQPGAFQPGNTTLRNPTVQPLIAPDDRTDCIINPGAHSIKSGTKETVDLKGTFKGSLPQKVDVYLGSLKVDEKGRLLFLAGNGYSRSLDDPADPYPLIMTDFDNPNWVDDTCDGIVSVKVKKGDRVLVPKSTARVVGTTPKFSSAIYAPTTLFDVVENVYAKAANKNDVNKAVGDVEYWRDVWDILQRPALLSWVNGQANGGHGPSGKGNFYDKDWQDRLQSPDAANEAARKIIYGRLRLPDVPENQADRKGQAFPYFMPWLSGDGGRTTAGDETTFASLTELQYARLAKWADGHFTVNPANRPNAVKHLEDLPVPQQPEALTRAHLEWTIGAPLYPGIELSWNAEEASSYDLSAEALARPGTLGWRINATQKAGDLTKYLSLPWQSDFYMCRNYWWPSARPDAVVKEEKWKVVEGNKDPLAMFKAIENRAPWERGLHQNYTDVYSDQPLFANTDMAQNWHKLGFVVHIKDLPPPNAGPGNRFYPQQPIFVETQRQEPHPEEHRHPQAPAGLAAFAAQPHALASFDAHARAQRIPFTMPKPDATAKHPPTPGGVLKSGKNCPIQTIESLRTHLQFALAVELSTIPLYLYAQFSIKVPAKQASDPRYIDPVIDALKGVVTEEMLHLSLAGNVLKAIGGRPRLYVQQLDGIKIFPTYPMEMPQRVPPLQMNLRTATKPHFDTFLGIEKPQQSQNDLPEADQYETLGQFYHALQLGLKYLAEREGQDKLFDKATIPFQFAPGVGYQPRVKNAGGSIVVKDLETAWNALQVIIDEGEGANCTENVGDEKAHYFIFRDLMNGSTNWDCYPVMTNPTTQYYGMHSTKQIFEVSRTLDAAYCYLLLTIEKLWDTKDDDVRRQLVLANMYSIMLGVIGPLARLLVTQPLEDGSQNNAGPCFCWFEFAKESSPFSQLRAQMKRAMLAYVDVTAETMDQVAVHDFGAQIDALLPVQAAVDNLLDLETFKKKVSSKSLSKSNFRGETQGNKGFAKGA